MSSQKLEALDRLGEPKPGFKPPSAGGLPGKARRILSKAYSGCRSSNPDYSKERCSKISWGAVKNAGYYQDKDGNWHAPKRSDGETFILSKSAFFEWCRYWYGEWREDNPDFKFEVSSGSAGLAMPRLAGTKKDQYEAPEEDEKDTVEGTDLSDVPLGRGVDMKYAVAGRTPTIAPGFGNATPTGTGLVDQADESHSDCMCDRRERLERFMIQEGLLPIRYRMFAPRQALLENKTSLIQESKIPFYAHILAAYPTMSQNRRRYSAELLKSAVKPYIGRPFILDHDYEDSWKVMGRIVNARYGVDVSEYTGKQHEGLWLDAVGLIPEELYVAVKGWCPPDGGTCVPSLIRGVSIGGEGEGDPFMGGVDIKQFTPQELSMTAFPGIQDAHISSFEMIESLYPKREEN